MPSQIKYVLIIGLISGTLLSCAKREQELKWNAELETLDDSRYLLKNQMPDSLYQTIQGRRVKMGKRLIKTEDDAIALGKEIFWKDFGKDYHPQDRRYMAHLVNGFWVIKGLQPIGFTGGALVAVVDSENGDKLYSLVWK